MLLKGLAQRNPGLCVVTTREPVRDLTRWEETSAPELELTRLSDAAGASLLQRLLEPPKPKRVHQVPSTVTERQEISRAVKGHALTLRLLGGYIHRALRDVRRWREIDYSQADAQYLTHASPHAKAAGDASATGDATSRYGHAFTTMAAYQHWLASGGQTGQRQLAVLRLLGLFDRPASASLLQALRACPAFPHLTEPLQGISQEQWNTTLSELEECGLVEPLSASAISDAGAVDAHPLLREYFATQLKTQHPEAWRAGHQRLFEHLCATTHEGQQPTLQDLQPLYQAVAHGCQAGLAHRTCHEVYYARICRRDEAYSTHKLGAIGSDLGAVACFFEEPWSRVASALREGNQAWLLNQAAVRLRALGRLGEALTPMRAALQMHVQQEIWESAARCASNLSELALALGHIVDGGPISALQAAAQAVDYADRSAEGFLQMVNRTTHADALHQAGQENQALRLFREAEAMQAKDQPSYPLLYSVPGFRYAELLLARAERAAWLACLQPAGDRPAIFDEVLASVEQRATQTLQWAKYYKTSLLTIALNLLTLNRSTLYTAVLQASALSPAAPAWAVNGRIASETDQAVDGLRRAGHQDQLPGALLTRAWLRHLQGHATGPNSAQTDLDEAWEIAERGPMPLFLADIHLHRARLFLRAEHYPWNRHEDGTPRGPADDLADARRLIEKHGYDRRREELEDAEEALKQWAFTIKPLAIESTKKMNIPNSVIYVVGDVLGGWYYSHSKLNTLFGGNGFPGEPPDGNCVAKCQSWLRRANDAPDVDPLTLLGRVLVEFMNLECDDEPRWQKARLRVTDVLAKNGYMFEVNGNIVPLSPDADPAPRIAPQAVTAIVSANSPSRVTPSAPAETTAPATTTQAANPTIVLVTVNDNETHGLLDAFVGVGRTPVQTTKGGVTYNELGIHGGYRLINTICEMGAGGVGASQQRTREAIEHWHPKAIIAVGIAFGLDESKQSIGDVLVATQIQDYDLGRKNEDGTLSRRGDKPSSADPLRNRLRQTDAMQTRLGNGWPKVRFGLVLSGQKLVDNLDYRESLKAIFTEAIGGEMEGTGLYVSASTAKVDWIVVKAICDWGHHKGQADKDAWQKLAAKNASRVLKEALEGGGL